MPGPTVADTGKAAFWQELWANDVTGWRGGRDEENAQVAIQVCRACGLREGLAPGQLPNATQLAAATKVGLPLFRGKKVLVPLCGDTKVMAALAAAGAVVVGLDVHVPGLRTAIKEAQEDFAPSVGASVGSFTLVESSIKLPGDEGGVGVDLNLSFDAVAGVTSPFPGSLRLIGGDFYAACAALAAEMQEAGVSRFDAVYDRGSFCAIPFSMRPRYIASIESVVAKDGVRFVDTAEVGGALHLLTGFEHVQPPSTLEDSAPVSGPNHSPSAIVLSLFAGKARGKVVVPVTESKERHGPNVPFYEDIVALWWGQ